MKQHFRVIAVLTALLFIALGAVIAHQKFTPTPAKDHAVQQLWALKLKDSHGKEQALQQWQGKIVVLNFWATWCKPCVQEMPELQALHQELQAKNVQLLGIGIDSPSNISEFAQKHQISYPLFAAGMEGTALSQSFGNQVGGLPYTALVDQDGKIAKTYMGRLNIEDLRRDILNLLK
ncbi:MAG: TlpA family protein disulfide reductase [Burkholderiales bacterium]|nr:TlpA family protein disulfide reductase [Burkholderiales bacterium]